MILSKELEEQLQRFRTTKSFALRGNLKKDLKDVIKMIKGYALNTECSTCCRNAMRELDAYMVSFDDAPVLQMKKSAIAFTGVKQKSLEEMSYKEIREIAAEKGIRGNIKRDELIKRIRA
jgi:hypothetical protein